MVFKLTITRENSILNFDSKIQIMYQHMTDEELFFILKIESKQAVCPKCSQLSDKAHSRYTRCFKDLPISGLAVRIQLI